jgi:DNA-directed RNA polymerase subunit M/transcription elongation factor TFIIS
MWCCNIGLEFVMKCKNVVDSSKIEEDQFDYCEHCGTTSSPARKYIYRDVLEGVSKNDTGDMNFKPKIDKILLVCSDCGKILKEITNGNR